MAQIGHESLAKKRCQAFYKGKLRDHAIYQTSASTASLRNNSSVFHYQSVALLTFQFAVPTKVPAAVNDHNYLEKCTKEVKKILSDSHLADIIIAEYMKFDNNLDHFFSPQFNNSIDLVKDLLIFGVEKWVHEDKVMAECYMERLLFALQNGGQPALAKELFDLLEKLRHDHHLAKGTTSKHATSSSHTSGPHANNPRKAPINHKSANSATGATDASKPANSQSDTTYKTTKTGRDIRRTDQIESSDAQPISLVDLTTSEDSDAEMAIQVTRRYFLNQKPTALQEIRSANTYLTDQSIELFLNLVNKRHGLDMQTTLYAQRKSMYKPLARNVDDIQILFLGDARVVGHYICIHYRAKESTLYVYDPLNVRNSWNEFEDVIYRRYPHLKKIVQPLPKTLQPDQYSCGVFACAYATTIILHEEPAEYALKCDPSEDADRTLPLREHLAKMIENDKLSLFSSWAQQNDDF